ncbi:hypothetical protein ACA910_017755 [Epithemia clementina (nom. ined.)]
MFRCLITKARVSSTYRWYHFTPGVAAKLNVEQLADRVNLQGENVLVRVDLNVPLAKDNISVTDDTRIRSIVPTVNFLLGKGANVILCSHFGRPEGEIIETGENGRLNPVVKPLEELLGKPVKKVDDCIGPVVEAAASDLDESEVLLLENTRFYKGETQNDACFSAGLGKLADYYVNDAFGTAHRAHSSTVGVTEHMKLNAAGYLMEKELHFLIRAVESPNRPLMSIVGGAKVSTKVPILDSLLDKCDVILLGGAMIFTFLKALGHEVGKSVVENDMVEMASSLMMKAEDRGVKFVLPSDVILAEMIDNDANTAVARVTDISGEWMGLDVGPETLQMFSEEIAKANTILWNGPMGVFEMSSFANGTNTVAQLLADATSTRGALTIIGGGDSVAAVNKIGLGDKISHISTGGGASLELLEGKILPGVAALTEV